jgi:reverse gyrase
MAFSDTQTVTVNSVAQTLPRTGFGASSGTFASADGAYSLVVSSAYGKRTRRTIRLSHQKISADPLIPSQNVRNTMSTYIVVDTPLNGYTVTEIKQIVDGLTAFLTASTGANVTKLLGGEN